MAPHTTNGSMQHLLSSTISLDSLVEIDIQEQGNESASDLNRHENRSQGTNYSTQPFLYHDDLVDINLHGFIQVDDYNGPHDPKNPQNWRATKKWYCIFVIGMMCFINNVGASVISLAIPAIAEDFDVTRPVATLGLSFYVFGLGIGPMLSAPLSEQFGRKNIYKVSYILFIFAQLPAALESTHIEVWLFFRLLGGIFASPGPAVGTGTVADLFTPPTRALPLFVFVSCAFGGAAFGPALSGILISSYHWQWTLWVTMILSACLFPFVYIMPETYRTTILDDDVRSRQMLGERVMRPRKAKFFTMITVALHRPLTLLATEPIVLLFSLYSGFVCVYIPPFINSFTDSTDRDSYMLLYGFTSSLPYIYQKIYSYPVQRSGLPFIAICLGVFLTVPINMVFFEPRYKRHPLPIPAEARLPPMVAAAIAMVISLFLFAWTVGLGKHESASIIAAIIFGYAALGLFVPHITYITDCFPAVAASASGANGLLRYTMGCIFPLFSRTMVINLGVKWSMTILGGIAIAMLPLPLIFMNFGAKIRRKGTFDRHHAARVSP